MNENVITMNVPNTITITLMAAIGLAVFGAVAGFITGGFTRAQQAA